MVVNDEPFGESLEIQTVGSTMYAAAPSPILPRLHRSVTLVVPAGGAVPAVTVSPEGRATIELAGSTFVPHMAGMVEKFASAPSVKLRVCSKIADDAAAPRASSELKATLQPYLTLSPLRTLSLAGESSRESPAVPPVKTASPCHPAPGARPRLDFHAGAMRPSRVCGAAASGVKFADRAVSGAIALEVRTNAPSADVSSVAYWSPA